MALPEHNPSPNPLLLHGSRQQQLEMLRDIDEDMYTEELRQEQHRLFRARAAIDAAAMSSLLNPPEADGHTNNHVSEPLHHDGCMPCVRFLTHCSGSAMSEENLTAFEQNQHCFPPLEKQFDHAAAYQSAVASFDRLCSKAGFTAISGRPTNVHSVTAQSLLESFLTYGPLWTKIYVPDASLNAYVLRNIVVVNVRPRYYISYVDLRYRPVFNMSTALFLAQLKRSRSWLVAKMTRDVFRDALNNAIYQEAIVLRRELKKY